MFTTRIVYLIIEGWRMGSTQIAFHTVSMRLEEAAAAVVVTAQVQTGQRAAETTLSPVLTMVFTKNNGRTMTVSFLSARGQV
jgi:hypothetical protein